MKTTSKWLTALGLLVLTFGPIAQAQPPVLQRGYDAGVTGANLAETTLNTSNVALKTFGLVFTLPVDDAIFAQPLYVPNVAIPNQGTHNVVYVATMSDTLYAFDADVPGAPLWSVDFASLVGAVPVPLAQFVFSGNKNLVGNLGILSTPVIDPSTHILYLVACTLEGGAMVYRLHAVDITTGAEPYGPGVLISGSYGTVTFDARYQVQRVSLVLSGQQVVFAFAAVELEGPGNYSGWVMAYNKSTLQQSGAFATETTGNLGGGVWQSGRPPVVDSSGYVYVFSGNAYGNGYDGVNNFSESALKLDPAHGMKLVDWFTPYDWSDLDDNDFDLSSSGPLLIPGTSELAGGGKTGYLYVLNTANLGKFNAGADTQIIQEEKITSDEMIRGGPVYWQRSAANGGPLLYDWAGKESLKAYAFNGTTFGANPSTESIGTQIPPGGILTLSANGEQSGSGVLWATVATSGDDWNDPPVPGELRAFNAADLSQELWNSSMNWPSNEYGNFAKYVPPLVVNGKVYVATWSSEVAVYGLLPTQQAAPPSFTPAAGVYAKAQSVTLSDSTPGAVIHYTTDGTTPTPSSAKYSVGTPLQISSTTTLQAIAFASGYSSSTVALAIYTISGTPVRVALPSIDDLYGIASTGSAPQGDGLDGRGNDYAAALLGTSLNWAGLNFTFGTPGALDAVSHATITLPAGDYATLNLLGTAVNGNQAAQTFIVAYTDGTSSIFTQSLSDWFTPQGYAGETLVLQMAYRISSTGATANGPFNLYGYSFALNSTKTVKSLTPPSNADVVVLAVDLVPAAGAPTPAVAPTFSPAPGSYGSAQSVTLSDTTPGAVIYYTTNGTTPTTSSAQFSPGTPISVSTTTTIEAIAAASGYSNSAVASGTYTIAQAGAPVSVALTSFTNVDAIANTGASVQNGGIDGRGNAYAEALLGASIAWDGATFALGGAGTTDAVSATIVPLPAGNYSGLSVLGTAVNGDQVNQTFVVTYTDGTTTTLTQSMSDWFTPAGYAGESQAAQMAYRILSSGAVDDGPFNLYGYAFSIDSTKTVKSIMLPKNRDVVVLAVDLVPL